MRTSPFQEALTLRNLWALGYQVIASYEHSISSSHGDLWPHIPYWWANKCRAEALIEEFEARKQHGRPGNVPTDMPARVKNVCKMLERWPVLSKLNENDVS